MRRPAEQCIHTKFVLEKGDLLQIYTLLAGAQAFWERAESDARAAKSRLYVQAMTFEADDAGGKVGDAITASAAADRRVLVDHFSRFVISDRFIRSPAYLTDKAFRQEVRATHEMFRAMRTSGVGVRLTNPMGLLLSGFAFRNHKKLIVADDVAYIGGINFSDHNFEWGDLMLRIEHKGVADRLAQDFLDTYAGRARSWRETFGELRLIGLDGLDNHPGFDEILHQIEAASQSVVVVSPYLTFPFVDALAQASARGVKVQLITPLRNNKPSVRDYLLRAAEPAGFDVRLTPEMIHLKGMLIDRRTLVLGSSNFDFVSYHAEEELVAMLTDPGLIADFETMVIAPALETALPPGAYRPSAWAGLRSHLILKTAERVIRSSRYRRRTSSDWIY
jgi:cardiolipin synthase